MSIILFFIAYSIKTTSRGLKSDHYSVKLQSIVIISIVTLKRIYTPLSMSTSLNTGTLSGLQHIRVPDLIKVSIIRRVRYQSVYNIMHATF